MQPESGHGRGYGGCGHALPRAPAVCCLQQTPGPGWLHCEGLDHFPHPGLWVHQGWHRPQPQLLPHWSYHCRHSQSHHRTWHDGCWCWSWQTLARASPRWRVRGHLLLGAEHGQARTGLAAVRLDSGPQRWLRQRLPPQGRSQTTPHNLHSGRALPLVATEGTGGQAGLGCWCWT